MKVGSCIYVGRYFTLSSLISLTSLIIAWTGGCRYCDTRFQRRLKSAPSKFDLHSYKMRNMNFQTHIQGFGAEFSSASKYNHELLNTAYLKLPSTTPSTFIMGMILKSTWFRNLSARGWLLIKKSIIPVTSKYTYLQ